MKIVKILGKEYDIETTTKLELTNKGLYEIPTEINELINLEELWLNHNNIEKIENIDNLKKLKKLYLYDNEIEKIEGLDNNILLRRLSLELNNIKDIENIHHLEYLEELCIFGVAIYEDIEEARKISLINERAKKLSLI